MKKLNLETFAGGALSEQVSRAFREVMYNLQDANTSHKDKRKISIELTFVQNEARDDSNVSISVKTKLAPVIPSKTQFFVGQDLYTGEVDFEEYGNRNMIKGQMEFDLKDKQEEVTEEENSEPKNLRNFKQVK